MMSMTSIHKQAYNKYVVFDKSTYVSTVTFNAGRSYSGNNEITWIKVHVLERYPFSDSMFRVPNVIIYGIKFKYCSIFKDHIILGFYNKDDIDHENIARICFEISSKCNKFITKWYGINIFFGKRYIRKYLERLK
jgi:hypothetical protein